MNDVTSNVKQDRELATKLEAPAARDRYRDLAYAVAASVVCAILVAIPVAIAIVETAHG